MKMTDHLKSFAIVVAVVLVMLVVVSVFDIILAVLYARFYSNASFIVTFGVAGIFAGLFAFGNGIKMYKENAAKARWIVSTMVVSAGLSFCFLIAPVEGGEYEVPFIAYGVTLAASGVFFAWLKVDF